MTDVETLGAEAILGDEADKFMRSDLGKIVLGLAAQEAELAVEKLKTVDPANYKAIQALQNEVWRAESVERWLRELIIEGDQALKIIEHDEAKQ
jgi:hypothetical protein